MLNNCNGIYINECHDSIYVDLISNIIKEIQLTIYYLSATELLISNLGNRKGYEILEKDSNLYIIGSNSEMLYLALTKVKYMYLCSNNIIDIEDINDIFYFQTREQYIHNIDMFEPIWKYIWNAPAWLLDYEEKKDSFPKANRPMCWAHRGGGEYYPENSAEAIISSIKRGADIMELDFRYTKDKRIVLMHYDTLHQSTDWELKKGRYGLPESDLISDWTYDEILKLRLKAGRLFDLEAITEYIVPTLEDVLYICNKHVFFIVDKLNPYQEWHVIYDSIVKTGCFEAFSFAYDFPEEKVKQEQEKMLQEVGATGPYFYLRKHAGSLEREMLSISERIKVFDECSVGGNTAIMTNYVKELVEYIDEHYKLE